MRHLLLSFIFLFIGFISFSQNTGIGVGTTSPHPSAALEISDTSKGILIPRMTMNQRLAIQNPADGLMVYQTDSTKGFWYWDGQNWLDIKNNIQLNQSFNHYVGESFGGGIIFHLYRDSIGIEHGLIVSVDDLNYVPYSYSNNLIGINAQNLWDGKQNTISIINQSAGCCNCAQRCADYRGGGFSDWFLPSIYQLSLLWGNFFEINKSIYLLQGAELQRYIYYWSSTEYNAGEAYEFGFYNGEIKTWGKASNQISHMLCRAIRSF